MVLLKGLPWHRSYVALEGLKQMLWGFEALRIFDDKLNKALIEVEDAKNRIRSLLTRGSESRHRDMVRTAETVTEDLDKRYSRLKNAHSSILQRIEQGTKLREGITSVLGVEQNENISMLTWLTILYLPPAFVAAIFNRTIVPLDWHWQWFIWLLLPLLAFTVAFSLSLQKIISWTRSCWELFVSRVWGPLMTTEQDEVKPVSDKKYEKARPDGPDDAAAHESHLRRRRPWPV
jgi:hypothetical protein